MTPELRTDLDIIDAIIVKHGALADNPMWNILSALRGPDDENKLNKQRYTQNIREKALPRTSQQYSTYWRGFLNQMPTLPWAPVPLGPYGDPEGHFLRHVEKARKVLEL